MSTVSSSSSRLSSPQMFKQMESIQASRESLKLAISPLSQLATTWNSRSCADDDLRTEIIDANHCLTRRMGDLFQDVTNTISPITIRPWLARRIGIILPCLINERAVAIFAERLKELSEAATKFIELASKHAPVTESVAANKGLSFTRYPTWFEENSPRLQALMTEINRPFEDPTYCLARKLFINGIGAVKEAGDVVKAGYEIRNQCPALLSVEFIQYTQRGRFQDSQECNAYFVFDPNEVQAGIDDAPDVYLNTDREGVCLFLDTFFDDLNFYSPEMHEKELEIVRILLFNGAIPSPKNIKLVQEVCEKYLDLRNKALNRLSHELLGTPFDDIHTALTTPSRLSLLDVSRNPEQRKRLLELCIEEHTISQYRVPEMRSLLISKNRLSSRLTHLHRLGETWGKCMVSEEASKTLRDSFTALQKSTDQLFYDVVQTLASNSKGCDALDIAVVTLGPIGACLLQEKALAVFVRCLEGVSKAAGNFLAFAESISPANSQALSTSFVFFPVSECFSFDSWIKEYGPKLQNLILEIDQPFKDPETGITRQLVIEGEQPFQSEGNCVIARSYILGDSRLRNREFLTKDGCLASFELDPEELKRSLDRPPKKINSKDDTSPVLESICKKLNVVEGSSSPIFTPGALKSVRLLLFNAALPSARAETVLNCNKSIEDALKIRALGLDLLFHRKLNETFNEAGFYRRPNSTHLVTKIISYVGPLEGYLLEISQNNSLRWELRSHCFQFEQEAKEKQKKAKEQTAQARQ